MFVYKSLGKAAELDYRSVKTKLFVIETAEYKYIGQRIDKDKWNSACFTSRFLALGIIMLKASHYLFDSD